MQPTDEIFNEIKRESIKVWRQNYDDTYGYVTEKVSYIEPVNNVKDNWAVIIGMFDRYNQAKLFDSLSVDTLKFLKSQTPNYALNDWTIQNIINEREMI